MTMFKTTPAKTPTEYIALQPEPRRQQLQQLHQLIRKTVPRLKPFIISGMIGYGKYHYQYASGRTGDWALVALASQKNYISLYICKVVNGKYIPELYKQQLPKASIGKSCVRFKRVADIDLAVIKTMLRQVVR